MSEMLNPRYKVLAEYPDNKFGDIGNVVKLVKGKEGKWKYSWYDYDGLYFQYESFFQEYPHLFKKLEWWEDRKPEELPDYIKGILESKEVFLKKELIENGFKYKWLDRDGYNMMHISKFMPSDESEYKQSL